MDKNQFRTFRSAFPGIEAVSASTRHRFPRHTHDQFGIGVIIDGAHRSLSGRGTVEAMAGDIITVNPGEVHDGAPIGDGGRSWRMLYFDPALVEAVAAELESGPGAAREFCNPVLQRAGAVAWFNELFTAVTTTHASDGALRAEQGAASLLADVLRERAAPTERPRTPRAIPAARDLIDADPAAGVSLADLARVTGLSRFQVLRGFVAATGLTPHAYLIQRRIHLARREIARGTSLSEAALVSGFADQSHMTRVFSARFGITPGAYAAALTERPGAPAIPFKTAKVRAGLLDARARSSPRDGPSSNRE